MELLCSYSLARPRGHTWGEVVPLRHVHSVKHSRHQKAQDSDLWMVRWKAEGDDTS